MEGCEKTMDDKQVKLCVICGAPVTAKWHTKTCSTACSRALGALQNKEACKRWRTKQKSMKKKEPQGKRAEEKKPSISDIETMARNAHMSYGKFVAKYLTSSLSKQPEG